MYFYVQFLQVLFFDLTCEVCYRGNAEGVFEVTLTENRMQNMINIRVETDPNITSPQVIIKTDSQSELTEKIVYAIERCIESEYPKVTAINGDTMVLLNQWDIIRVFTQKRKLSICSQNGIYESKFS